MKLNLVLLFWILTWGGAEPVSPTNRRLSAALIVIALLNGLVSGFSRHHDPLRWRDYVNRCMAGKINKIPIHHAGDAQQTWTLWISPKECRRLVDAGLIRGKP